MSIEELSYVEYSDVSTGMDIHVMLEVSDQRLGYSVSVWDGEQYDSALNIGEYKLGSSVTKITQMLNQKEMFKGLEMIADTYLNALKCGIIELEEAFNLCSNLTVEDIRGKLKEDSLKDISSKYRKMRTRHRSVRKKERRQTKIYILN